MIGKPKKSTVKQAIEETPSRCRIWVFSPGREIVLFCGYKDRDDMTDILRFAQAACTVERIGTRAIITLASGEV